MAPQSNTRLVKLPHIFVRAYAHRAHAALYTPLYNRLDNRPFPWAAVNQPSLPTHSPVAASHWFALDSFTLDVVVVSTWKRWHPYVKELTILETNHSVERQSSYRPRKGRGVSIGSG